MGWVISDQAKRIKIGIMKTPPLLIDNISKSFGRNKAVSEVSFAINAGEIVGFLGPNGAGKTTTLRMALGLIKPDRGRVELFGQAPGPEIFGRVGFLPEERGLYKKQTARDSIAHMARLNGIKGREAYKLAEELLEKYGLGDAVKKKNKDMSKGMAQKVQLLGAIAHNPEFYILDEPFSGLDPVNQKVLEDMVREIASRGSTIIFSTHVMEHAERLCDRVILMSGGEKVFDGNLAQALDKAPRRLVLSTDYAGIERLMAPFINKVERREDGALSLILNPEAQTQTILETLVKEKVSLKRFEPKTASLHEAFVAMVGHDFAANMGVVGEGTS